MVSFSPLCKKGCIFRIVRHCNKAFKMHADAFTHSQLSFFFSCGGKCVLVFFYQSFFILPFPARGGGDPCAGTLLFHSSSLPSSQPLMKIFEGTCFAGKGGAFSAFILSTNFFDIRGTRRFFCYILCVCGISSSFLIQTIYRVNFRSFFLCAGRKRRVGGMSLF